MPVITLTAFNGPLLGPIAKVLGWCMNLIYLAMYHLIGTENVGFSIVLFTIVIYTILLPFTYKQQKFSKMNAVMQPELDEIRAKYKDRKDNESMQAMNDETKLVYQKYGVSTGGNCLQMIIQMIVLFALYRVFFNIPAYIGAVKDNYTDLVNGIVAGGYVDKMADLVTDFKISLSVTPDWTTTGDTLNNFVVDVLNKLPSTGWDSLTNYFPTLGTQIADTASHVEKFNYIFSFGNFKGLNIADSPLTIIRNYWETKQFAYMIIALLIPICSFISQVISIRLMPQQGNSGNEQADQMATQMKTMNTIMPIFSLVLCFGVPVGLGIYWVISAVYRCIQQFFINRHFDKIGMTAMVEKQQAAAQKKKEKKGVNEEKIRQAAQIRTKNIGSRANMTTGEKNEIQEQYERANEIKANAKPGTLASYANLVKDFNERNSRK